MGSVQHVSVSLTAPPRLSLSSLVARRPQIAKEYRKKVVRVLRRNDPEPRGPCVCCLDGEADEDRQAVALGGFLAGQRRRRICASTQEREAALRHLAFG
jgi:hypothetical protein